ncbi:MAG: alpha/beta fold hydrolase [Phototrophicales bacterium]|nr:alpha/beta fold hydrolase [Phototrophicales bacterium]
MRPDLSAFRGDIHQPFTLQGQHTAILMIHGFPGTPAEMRPLAPLFHDMGFTVRGVLLPGFGTDIETLPTRTYADWINALCAEVQALSQTHERLFIVGFSMGGALAVKLTHNMQKWVTGLILYAPFWKIDHVAWRAMPIIQTLFPQPRIFKYMPLDFNKPEVRDGISRFMPNADLDDPQVHKEIRDFRLPVRMFSQIHKAGHEAYRLAPRITCPTLVIQGLEDDLVRPLLTEKFAKRFIPKARYETIHAPHVLIDPKLPDWEKLTTITQQFIERIG